jgi:hypothetical protein
MTAMPSTPWQAVHASGAPEGSAVRVAVADGVGVPGRDIIDLLIGQRLSRPPSSSRASACRRETQSADCEDRMRVRRRYAARSEFWHSRRYRGRFCTGRRFSCRRRVAQQDPWARAVPASKSPPRMVVTANLILKAQGCRRCARWRRRSRRIPASSHPAGTRCPSAGHGIRPYPRSASHPRRLRRRQRCLLHQAL